MAGTGKTTLIQDVLKETKARAVWTDCVEYQEDSLIATHILVELSLAPPTQEETLSQKSFAQLVEILTTATLNVAPHYFVFDHADKVFGEKLFRKLLVMKSRIEAFGRFIFICDGAIPNTKHCSEYLLLQESFMVLLMEPPTLSDLTAILGRQYAASPHVEYFGTFMGLLHGTFANYTCSIPYFAYLCSVLFPIYTEPLDRDAGKADRPKGPLPPAEVAKLYSGPFRKQMKQMLKTLFLPIQDVTAHWKDEEQRDESVNFAMRADSQVYGQVTKHGLTYLEGILLVSAYIAACNPEVSDQRIFVQQKQ
jgi:hypothetical protein